jgi:4-alpha-glucanotransferase
MKTKPSLYLGLAFHNHQPVGNFPWVFQQAYDQAYLPMLEALERRPAVRVSLHYSGPLLDWLRDNRPDFLPRLSALVRRGQVEMMTGGYYEPILPAIPEADQLGQIAKMTGVMQDELGAPTTGLWLTERVWEPHLPATLARAGVEWTIVDDTHFKTIGLDDDDLFGYYLTEEQGRPLKVFATSKHMRYLIPWRDVSEVIGWLREQATPEGDRIVVMGDDGEKFGMWPETFEHCWQKGWMERFFAALEDEQDWLTMLPLGEYARRFPPLGRAYIPTASYSEMLQWALPTEKSARLEALAHRLEESDPEGVLPFLRGGFWRHFLGKYEEINLMHKKMWRAHRLVQQAGGAGQDALWKAQCNCAYWHGVFGGIYLADVRATNYANLVRAETEAYAVLHPPGDWWRYEMVDYDLDGQAELLIEGAAADFYLDPDRGGVLYEWDLRQPPYNLASSLSRRPEVYHQALLRDLENPAHPPGAGPDRADEEGISCDQPRNIHDGVRFRTPQARTRPVYDTYLKACLLDHFLPADATAEAFAAGHTPELGDFLTGRYECVADGDSVGTPGSGSLRLALWRDGWLQTSAGARPVRVEKTLRLQPGQDGGLVASYRIINTGNEGLEALFASEWNLNLLGGGGNPAAYLSAPWIDEERLDVTGDLEEIGWVALGNRGLGVYLRLELDQQRHIWRMPLETLSNSEGGIEKTYQATTLLVVAPLLLAPGDRQEMLLRWMVG